MEEIPGNAVRTVGGTIASQAALDSRTSEATCIAGREVEGEGAVGANSAGQASETVGKTALRAQVGPIQVVALLAGVAKEEVTGLAP